MSLDLARIRFDAAGLVPVVTQDAASGQVLMVAWANREALQASLASGRMHYWSRSRAELWEKGATSGNTQRVQELALDCDGDTVLASVEANGPACHTGRLTCFESGESLFDVLHRLQSTISDRRASKAEDSYTARLLSDPALRLKKIGEEAAELVVALAQETEDRVIDEAADLVYHTMVGLAGRNMTWNQVLTRLQERMR